MRCYEKLGSIHTFPLGKGKGVDIARPKCRAINLLAALSRVRGRLLKAQRIIERR